jgi:hypothetical protein
MEREDWLKMILMWLYMGLMLGIIYSLISFGNYSYERYISCPRYGTNLVLETKYDFWGGGCFIKYENQWIDTDNFRVGKLD